MENKLVPVEIKKHHSLGRFIRNKITLAAVSYSNKGFEKLSDEDTRIVASIINTGLIQYNEKNGHPLSDEDIKKIQERFNEFDAYTFEGDSERYKKRYEKQEKKLGHKLTGIDTKGFLFTPTSILMLKKDEWEQFKKGEKIVYFTKVVTHEGFHFLTNTKHNNMSKIGEKLTSEGADESFIVKTFNGGRHSRIINDAQKNGLIHYNFDSESNYGPLISIINMLGTMVDVNPEVSALKNDGEFVKAVKQKYGDEFFKRIIKVTEKLADPTEFNKIENAPRYCKTVQNKVIKTITDDILENVKNPEDAVRRLKTLQKAEEWSMRILIARRDHKTRKFIEFDADKSFENYYRYTYVRVIDRLEEKGFTNVEQMLEQCRYKETSFRKLSKVDLENSFAGRVRFKKRIKNSILFYENYYGEKNPEKYIDQEQLALYDRIIDGQKKKIAERKPDLAEKRGYRQGPTGVEIKQEEILEDIQKILEFNYQPPKQNLQPVPKRQKDNSEDYEISFGEF